MTAKATTTKTPRKPRKDAGKTHKAGAGRPAGTGKAAKAPAELVARMAKVDTFLTKYGKLYQASGVAGLAKMTPATLRHLREGVTPTEERVAALEAAILQLAKLAAAASGCHVSRIY